LAYAELAAIVPISGSAYTYSYAALGELIAWLVGWNLILEYAVSVASVASGWSGYVVGLLGSAGIELPKMLTAVPANGGIVDIPAILILLVITYLLVRGIKESASTNNILVYIKIGAVFLFLLLAGPEVSTANWTPFMPFGFAGVAGGAAIVFFAYLGFDAVSTSAEECRNPQRDLPRGMLGSLAICTVLYIAVAAVLTGVIPYERLNNAEPVAFALRELGYNIGSALVGTGAICGLTSVLLVTMYGQSRIFFAMSRDGLIPSSICEVHPQYGTPHIITWICGIAIAGVAGFTPIDVVAELANIGTLFAFAVTAIGVLVLRYTKPDLPRTFRCPAVHIMVPLAVISCSYLAYNLPITTWIRFAVWTIIGLAIYFAYGYRKSNLNLVQKSGITNTDKQQST
jgi:basic amino acid/polyamine antiporter, APA family